MENQTNKPSIKISGSGSTGGGDFDQIKISGSGKIGGPATCQTLKISGSASVDGSMAAEDATISGSAKFNDSLKAGNLKISGSAKVEGRVEAADLKISGSFVAEDSLTAEHMETSGSLKVANDCSAEEFILTGQCKIGGLLNAGDIEIYLEGRSEIKTIGAERIKVAMGRYGSFIKDIIGLFADQSGKLICEAIEGDEIYLENTICEVVRGGRITIGRGCQIKLVEYSDSLEILEDARVEANQKQA